MPTRANISHFEQDSPKLSGQLPLDFSTPAPKSPSSRPKSSSAIHEVPLPTTPSRYLTRREAAAYVRCSLRFLDGMEPPFIRKGRCKVYDRIDLDARMQQDKCRGRAWKETLWPVNVDSTAARTRGSGGLASFSRMDAAYAQSTGCINRTDAESYVVRLKNEAIEAKQQGILFQDWRWLKGVPKIRMLKEPRRGVRFLRREEADRLIEALPEHMKSIVEFALSTGCRAGEILRLEWRRVDLTRKVAWLDHGTTKSGDGRGIPLNADAVAALEATRGQHPRWCFTFSGKRIQQSSTAWGKAKQRAGIEDFRFHDLRHTWASWHVQSGTSLPELMELGGWKSYEMVLRYAHLAPEKLSFVAGRIERQASRPIEEAPRVKNVAKNATFSLRSVN